MRRLIIPWIGAFAVLLLLSVGTIVVVNATALSAGSFVRAYLDALARGDVDSALKLNGVNAAGASPLLLDEAALPQLQVGAQLADDDLGDGQHRVRYAWSSGDVEGSTDFTVERVGTRFGVFPIWGFVQSPVATLALGVEHDPRFFIENFSADTGVEAGSNDTATIIDFAVFVPGSYQIGHETTFLTAPTQTVTADKPGDTLNVTLDVQANQHFVDEVQTQVDSYLADCASQEVLFPTGCPFGQEIDNRVVSTPSWSIVETPDVTIKPAERFATWRVPPATGVAHLVVKVQSLFDGSVSTFDEHVPFDVTFLISSTGDNTVTITSPDVG